VGIRNILALNLRQYRRAVGLSQEELAHRAEMDRTYISAIERCKYAASVDVLERLAAVLKVNPADLLMATSLQRSRKRKLPVAE
jgi:transcriptional regulator with XRE-family HTH domain